MRYKSSSEMIITKNRISNTKWKSLEEIQVSKFKSVLILEIDLSHWTTSIVSGSFQRMLLLSCHPLNNARIRQQHSKNGLNHFQQEVWPKKGWKRWLIFFQKIKPLWNHLLENWLLFGKKCSSRTIDKLTVFHPVQENKLRTFIVFFHKNKFKFNLCPGIIFCSKWKERGISKSEIVPFVIFYYKKDWDSFNETDKFFKE